MNPYLPFDAADMFCICLLIQLVIIGKLFWNAHLYRKYIRIMERFERMNGGYRDKN